VSASLTRWIITYRDLMTESEKGNRTLTRLTAPIRMEAVIVRGFDFVDVQLSAVLDSGIQRSLLRRVGPV
jgi:hypothetical protein